MPSYYPRRKYNGRGAYRKTYRGHGGYIKDTLDNFGSKGGAALGKWIGNAIEKYTGWGAYRKSYKGRGAYRRGFGGRGAYRKTIKGRGAYNEIEAGKIAPMPPTFSHSKDKNWVEICHREYIGDVYSSSSANTLAVSSFYINPSDTVTFPWLSQIAATSFQQYELTGCVFEFKSFSADALNSVNTALGSVVAAVNYDSTDPVPNTRAQLENTDWSQAFKPSDSFIVPVECARKETFGGGLLYTRQSQAIPSNQDRRMYDLGRLDIATLGVQGTSVNLGSLYVTYKVRLYKCVQFLPQQLNGCYHTWNTTSIAASTPLGTAANDTVVRNSIGFVHTSATVLTLPLKYCTPQAVYKLGIMWHGTAGSSCTAPSITFGGSLAAVNGIGTNASMSTSSMYFPGNTVVNTDIYYVYYFQVSSAPVADGTITFGTGGSYPGGTLSVDCQIDQISGAWNQST